MRQRSIQIALTVLLGLSIALNFTQYRSRAIVEELRITSDVKDRLFRLGINRTLLIDLDNPPSPVSRKLLHGSINMDLVRIQPRISDLSEAYQLRYQEILGDLNDFRRAIPDDFAAENLIMDSQMRTRYIELISTGHMPK